MRLQRLTGLEQDKIVNEYREVMETITDLLDILAKPSRITDIIADELLALKSEFGDARRSEIVRSAQDLMTEDLIAREDMVVTLSHTGYIKSQPLTDYRAQKRGGRGKQAAAMREDDWIDQLFIANTHDTILCFSNRGRLYWLKVWEVPQGARTARGKPIVNLFPLAEDEKITVVLPIKEYDEHHFVFMATAMGTVKKTALTEFCNPRKAGIIAVDLDAGDYLIGAAITDGQHDVMLFSDAGKAVRFDENDVRPMGRTARGVRGMKLDDGQQVIAMLVAEDEAAERADRDRERFRQAHADRRVHAPRARHQGHDRDRDQRAQRQGRRRDAGAGRRRDHADHDRRRADPHPRRRDPRDGACHAGRHADRARRRHHAFGSAARGRARQRGRQRARRH